MHQAIINKYLTAWEQSNYDILCEVLTPSIQGIRTFTKNVFFHLEGIKGELISSAYQNRTLKGIKTKNNVSIASIEISKNNIVYQGLIKFTFEKGLITKVYEVIDDTSIKRILCKVTYDGSRFNGFQRQPNQPTIQGTIENALHQITNEEITIHASGRTDKGVHALQQVFHFDTKSKITPTSYKQLLNKYLPDAIQIIESKEVDKTFHSRYDVLTKEYKYVINTKQRDIIKQNYEWYPGPFDIDILRREANVLLGIHSFQSFTKTNSSTSYIRTIYDVRIMEVNDYLEIYIKGNGFLRYMVRNIMAALVQIAQGKANYNIQELLDKKDNAILKVIAPSEGLYLNEVTYNE